MIDLRNQCVHPTSQKPYIANTSGGKQNSLEEGKKVRGGFRLTLSLYALVGVYRVAD